MVLSATRRAALAALGLSLSVACGGNNSPKSCALNSDCAAGQTCQAGECLAPGQCNSTTLSCTSANDCPTHNDCVGGCCSQISGCLSDTDCSGTTPHCDVTSHSCKACTSNGQCPAGAFCTPNGVCGAGCGSNADCTSPTPACHTYPGGISACSQCDTGRDCKSALTPTCSSGVCTGCSADKDCAGPTPACDAAHHTCVACTDSENVNGVNPKCPATAKACLAQACASCNAADNAADTTNGACPNATPACTAASTCVGCLPTRNDGTTGANPACPAATPTCGADSTCVACTVDTECSAATDYCGSDRACHTPLLASIDPVSAAVGAGGSERLTVSLDHAARVATKVTFTILDGPGSFDPASAVTTASTTIGVGETTSPATAVTYHHPGNNPGTAHVQGTVGANSLQSTLTLTDVPAGLLGFSASNLNVQVNGTATLTATLSASGSVTVGLANSAPAVGSVPDHLDIQAATSGLVTFTGLKVGTDTVTATYPAGTSFSVLMNVFDVTPLSLTPANSTAITGGTIAMTLAVSPAPPADATYTVSVSGPGTINGGASAVLTIPANSTSVSFNVVAAGNKTGTITVSAGAQSATINVIPTITSVSIAPVTGTLNIVGQPTVVTVALSAAPSSTQRVYLDDFNPTFATAFKMNAYLPSYLDIPAGSSSGTAIFNECKSLPPTNTDTLTIGAWIPGANEAESAPFIVCPLGATAAQATNGCGDTSGMTAALCAVYPFKLDQPKSTPLSISVAMAYKKPAAAGTVPVTFTFSPLGCASASQITPQTAAGVAMPITGLTLNENALGTSTSLNARAVQNFTLIPGSTLGPCAFTVSTAAAGVSPNSQSAVINIVSDSAAPSGTDLFLTKVEMDQTGSGKDTNEYVEIYNPTGGAIDLTQYTLVLVGSPKATIGANTGFYDDRFSGKSEYFSSALSGSLAAAGFVEVEDTGSTATFPAGVSTLKLFPYALPVTGTTTFEGIEDAPSGVFLVKGSAIIDGLSWGGPIVNATSPHINGGAAFSWPVTGHPLDSYLLDLGGFPTGLPGSFIRIATTGDNSLDWRYSLTVTPGSLATTVTGP